MDVVIAIASVASAVAMIVLVCLTAMHYWRERVKEAEDDTILFSSLRKVNDELLLILENIGRHPAVQMWVSLVIKPDYEHRNQFSNPIDNFHIPDALFPGHHTSISVDIPTDEKNPMNEGFIPPLDLYVVYETPTGVLRAHTAEFTALLDQQQAILVGASRPAPPSPRARPGRDG